MANRVLSEKIKTSPTLAKISFEAASAFLWALTEADPLGRMQDSPDAIAYALFANRPDIDSLRKKMSGWVAEWASSGLVQRYETCGRKCLQILKWAEYQRIHDGARSKYPDPPELPGTSGNFREDAGTCCSDSVLESVSDSVSESANAEKSKKPVEQFEVPSWVPAEPWADFCELRISRNKKTWTLGAKKRTIADLAKLREQGHDPAKVLNQSVQRGWMGVFAIKHEQASTQAVTVEDDGSAWERAAKKAGLI